MINASVLFSRCVVVLLNFNDLVDSLTYILFCAAPTLIKPLLILLLLSSTQNPPRRAIAFKLVEQFRDAPITSSGHLSGTMMPKMGTPIPPLSMCLLPTINGLVGITRFVSGTRT